MLSLVAPYMESIKRYSVPPLVGQREFNGCSRRVGARLM